MTMIGAWEILEDETTEPNLESTNVKPINVRGHLASQSAETSGEQVFSSTDSQSEALRLPNQEKVDIEPTEIDESVSDLHAETLEEQVSPSTNFQPEIFKKLIEIEARFNAQIQTSEIELKPPDFNFPADELVGWQNTDVAAVWIRIKNKYEYAQKINELSAKFGRIQPIVNELKSLTERFPTSLGLKRHLAYFYSLSGNWSEAIQDYQQAAISSQEADDWFNVAAVALKSSKEELDCYSL